jgi:processive 1,2-diacylglycerol beta-glucosyltransferase
MIINRVVPGQEEGNARLLLENDCGALARSPEAIVGAVNEAFRDSAKRWHRWFDNISKLSRPDAALVIARYVLDACKIRRA